MTEDVLNAISYRKARATCMAYNGLQTMASCLIISTGRSYIEAMLQERTSIIYYSRLRFLFLPLTLPCFSCFYQCARLDPAHQENDIVKDKKDSQFTGRAFFLVRSSFLLVILFSTFHWPSDFGLRAALMIQMVHVTSYRKTNLRSLRMASEIHL